MRQSQAIPFTLLFFAILLFGIVQLQLTSNLPSASGSLFNSFQTTPGQNYEAAELERQAGLNCAQ